jgi:iron complex transport system substrate-binding protein
LRIVSLVPANTEVLFALGLGEQVVGITEHCDFPQEAVEKEKVGRFAAPDLERIKTLQPDLVVAGGLIHSDIVQELLRSGIKVFDFAPHNVEELFSGMEEIIKLVGECKPGRSLISELRKRVDIIKEQGRGRAHPRVAFVLGSDTIAVPGRASCQYDAFSIVGVEQFPSTDEILYQVVTWEQVQDFDPELLLACGASPYAPARKRCNGCTIRPRPCARNVESLLELPQLQETAAVRNRNVETVPCHFFCRPGPRLIEGMEWLAGRIEGSECIGRY